MKVYQAGVICTSECDKWNEQIKIHGICYINRFISISSIKYDRIIMCIYIYTVTEIVAGMLPEVFLLSLALDGVQVLNGDAQGVEEAGRDLQVVPLLLLIL